MASGSGMSFSWSVFRASSKAERCRTLDSPEDFYDRLAEDYHLVVEDWRNRSIPYQAEVLDRFIQAKLGKSSATVLDCSCGIGTQAIGLALHGYAVTATDVSRRAVERAAHEAERMGVQVTFGVADMRTLATEVDGTFDVVLSCDNSIPHLLTDEDLQAAVRNMREKLSPGGLVIVSTRDYDALAQERPAGTVPRVFPDEDGRRVVFQLWDWDPDGRTYALELFLLRERAGDWETRSYATRYRALLREELTGMLEAAGFMGVQWHMPEETEYYQPIVTAH